MGRKIFTRHPPNCKNGKCKTTPSSRQRPNPVSSFSCKGENCNKLSGLLKPSSNVKFMNKRPLPHTSSKTRTRPIPGYKLIYKLENKPRNKKIKKIENKPKNKRVNKAGNKLKNDKVKKLKNKPKTKLDKKLSSKKANKPSGDKSSYTNPDQTTLSSSSGMF